MHVLQSIFSPLKMGKMESELYYRASGELIFSESYKKLYVDTNIKFNTYFNAFPARKYFENTSIEEVQVQVVLTSGAGLARIWGIGAEDHVCLSQKEIFPGSNLLGTLLKNECEKFELVYVEIYATTEIILEDIHYSARASQAREIKLAIITTTFNRQFQLKEMVSSLLSYEILDLNNQLFVMNNGDPVDLPDNDFIHIYKNNNIGGAGGFMKGVLAALQDETFTHVMFIDDDALCHPKSIQKASAFLSLARDSRACLAGAMLYEKKWWMQYEAGASINGINLIPNNLNLDLRNEGEIYINNKTDYADYGPWWFFMFPLVPDLKYSFPFFVRGDDVTFSLRNNFKPLMMNGICSWQESFDAKISPPTEYLAFRSFIMIGLVYSDMDIRKISVSIVKHVLSETYGLRYQIAFALCEAIEDILKGPSFWVENVQMARRLGEIKLKCGNILQEDINPLGKYTFDNYSINKKSIMLMFLTLGGHLLPKLFRREGISVLGNSSRPLAACFFNSIEHYSFESMKKSIFNRDLKKLVMVFFRLSKLIFKFQRNAAELREVYRSDLERFEKRDFWEKQ